MLVSKNINKIFEKNNGEISSLFNLFANIS